MKLKTQAYLLSGIILIALLALTATGLWTLRVASNMDNKARVTELFKSAYSILTEVEKMAIDGTLEEKQAKQLATRLLRNNIYKDNEYVYVADENMTFVATPLDPQLHGTSFNDFKDGDGNSVGQLIQRVLGNRTGQIIEYTWTQKLPDGTIEDKLSIAEKTPHWGWVVGTGIGFNEVNARFWSTAQWQLFLCVVIAGLILSSLIVSIKRMLALLGGEPKDVREAVQAVAEGRIQTSFETQAINGSIYHAVQQMSKSLAELVSNLDASMLALRAELQRVEDRAGSIAQLTETQQQSTEMIATAMTEMASSANNVADSASDTARNTDEADKQSQHTQQLIHNTVDNIQGLAGQLNTASEAVANLDSDVNNIVKVLDVIGDIAEQTNLLALNAAIEAARAGEQGRGFAVVADEVRNLAGRTQSSTKEIQLMINNLQEGSRNAIQTMEVCATTSESTVTESQSASEALQQIVIALESISSMSHQIATAAAEQTQVSDDISKRINMIEESGNQLSNVVTESHNSTQTLASLSNELEAWINRFEVKH
ncbi:MULTISPECIES: methyl-accepting chemotaxis protein [Vibrio]|uniref:Chemotaxis protein n=3 Tax=Vibrio cyclitrophicus TaxID=47951 RepID=A0A7Z1MJW3_9VIBR|nr:MULTISPECIES: methyl-accepting chemotaxis protein [Vibrio]MBY7663296.1 cache domain-containing protein [Vibrio atlanticus]ERM59810.1 N-acetylglucosamine regulated methyl-accepting chemotaxis protein [Vibrio cyclitrophicus FF75]KAA8596171.1 N-acetylglucosamine regulated methyl-accepting chemotaxis protein [Vibrio cyclitrophicus]MBU2930573.1 methyl-accepting chemotaxis protein [Vibrio cyclitrophicus]MCC4776336.1 methyl-accepting chemotaxis protein [Vibrio cyclitrophicus]|tara:strand:- start:195 stop:1820 length:1626 start_codon:yes stop_codon:yes gene_type:complete